MQRALLLLAVSVTFPSIAIAGVDLNAFQQHAATQAGYLSPPAVPSTAAPAPDSVPPPLPSAVPGADATGFSSAPATSPARTIAARAKLAQTTTAGAVPAPLPPALPPSTVAHNRSISATSPAAAMASSYPATIPDLSLKSIQQHAENVRTQQLFMSPTSTRNIAINASGYAPNVLVTPFRHPTVVTTQVATRNALITFQPFGSRLIFTLSPHYPVGVIVTGEHPSDPAYTFTLVPQDIPGRIYVLHIQHWHAAPPVSAQMSPSTRNRNLSQVFVAAAQKQMPPGFSPSRKLPPVTIFDHARIVPYARYVSLRYTLNEYRVTNLRGKTVRLSPADFYRKGVLAVSFWPDNHLFGHGQTRLFIVTHRAPSQGNFIGFIGRGD